MADRRPRDTDTYSCGGATGDPADEILDGMFHVCALAAFLDRAAAANGWPDPEATRRLAHRLYESALAARNRNPAP